MRLAQRTAAPLLATLLAIGVWQVGWAEAVVQQAESGEQRLQYRGEPVVLGRDAPRLGELVADLPWAALDGSEGRLSDQMGERGLVIAFRDVGCPLSKRYGPRLGRLEKEYRERGFGFLYVNVTLHDTDETAAQEIEWYGFEAPYVRDPEATIARELAAKTSTEVFVLDRARTLLYRGAVDDQYGLGYTRPAPRHEYLRDALDAVLAGEVPEIGATLAPGCYLSVADEGPVEARPVTYHNRVSRIIQNRCQRCHRPGGAGPFPMTTYRDVVGRKDMIQWVVTDGIMPPWYAEPGEHAFANDFSLEERERQDLLAWIDDGTPEGDPAEAPLPRRWTEGWTIGAPDVVFQIPEPIEVPAEGIVDYQYVYTKTDFPEDRWVKAMEIRPGAPAVVHHVLVFLESPEIRRRIREDREDREARRAWQSGVRGYFASTVPGQDGLVFPEGLAKKLPAGAWLKWQLHYTPNGRPAVDRTEIGFVFYDGEPVDMTEVRTGSAINLDLLIPAGAAIRSQAEYTFDRPAALLSLFPHTHLRGTGFLYELVYPDGTVRDLLDVARYDFNWQLNYELAEPLEVPAGTTLRATGWYDNRPGNPANPDPSVDVEFGEQTFEEMLIGYFNWIPLGEPMTTNPERSPR